MLTNARSVFSKFDELCALVSTHVPSIVSVTESWLRDEVDSSFLHVDGYIFVRSDRLFRIGGGVCIWCKPFYCPEIVATRKMPQFEHIALYLRRVDCLFILVYIPPNLNLSDSNLINTFLVDLIDGHLLSHPNSSIVICGDVNNHKMHDIETAFDVANVVLQPTRQSNILDKIFISSDIAPCFQEPVIIPPLATSDHNCILLKPLNCPPNVNMTCHTVFDYRRSNLNRFVDALSAVDFSTVYRLSDIDDKVDLFYKLLRHCMTSIPSTNVTLSVNDKPWMTPLIKQLINQRWFAFRTKNFSVYNHLKIKIKNEIIRAKKEWIGKSSKPKDLWRVVNDVRGTKQKNPLSSIVSEFEDNFEAVNFINNMFKSVFTGSTTFSPSFHSANTQENWTPLTQPHEIYHQLRNLPKKASGSDKIPTRVYKAGALYLAEPLCHIFNCCIQERYMPSLWKLANICVVPKSNPPKIDALRPISLLPAPGKMFEKIILHNMKEELIKKVDDCQFAYLPFSSTVCALVYMFDRLTSILEESDTVGVALISLDYSKAFDTICHTIIIQKLIRYGFSSGFIEWISSYLSNRSQRTIFGNYTSKTVEVTSGVPQGSILGPYLFILYTADLFDVSGYDCIKYADDTTLLIKLTDSIVSNEDRICTILDRIKQRSSDASLRLNTEKSKLLVVRKKSVCPPVIIPGIKTVTSLKLLGITIDNNLKWDLHFNDILKKCNQRLYALRILRPITTDDHLKTVYLCLIRSLLCYASPVFAAPILPHKICRKVDSFLRRCHRIIHRSDCVCDLTDSFRNILIRPAIKLFTAAENNFQHPLHHLIPPKLPHNKRYNIEFCRTVRRQSAFPVYMTIYLNSNPS